jgi:hypothetical protein
MAFEKERPVASALLIISEGLGYLRMALTAEPFRHGAQSALNRPADQQGGSVRMQDRRFGNVVDPRNGLRE